jgi:endonuclease/exonuclease/phosphatase (EEP) superfamily protein YafD
VDADRPNPYPVGVPDGSRRGRGRLVRFAFLGLCACSALSLVGMLLAPLALFAHFQAWWAAAWALGLLAWLVLPRVRGAFWRPCAARRVAQALLLVHALAVAWLWWPADEPQFEGGIGVELVFCNLHTRDQPWQALRAGFGDSPPDLLALVEAKHALLDPPTGYPHTLRSQHGGLVLYSRLPLRRTKVHSEAGMRDVLETEVVLPRGRMRLVVTHPNNHAARSHDREHRRLAGIVESLAYVDAPLIVVGDLNTTVWSPQMRHLLRAGGLRAACCDGRGPHVTWSPLPGRPLGLAIDHLLVGPRVAVDRLEWLPWLPQADHRGLSASLRVDTRPRQDYISD